MVYTQEQLMMAVREAGRTGQPFSVGEVRAQLGLKSKDKRELKRFRSRLRECLSGLGNHVEKLGPQTYRLKRAPPLATKPLAAAAARVTEQPAAELAASAAHAALKQRVGITPRGAEPTQRTQTVQLTAAERALALPADGAGPSLGTRVTAWLARVRGKNQNTAATALSRLALDLQPNASHFQYQWVDGDLRVKRQ